MGTIAPVPTVSYDPFEGVSKTVTFTVDLKNTGSETCSLSLAIASSTTGSNRYFKKGSDKLRYLVQTSGGDDYKNDIAQPRGSTSVDAGKTKPITVKVKVPSGLIGPWGTYNDTLTLRLYRNTSGSPVAMGADRTAAAAATIEKRAQVNIAGASGSSSSWDVDRIDFHTLTTGETKSANVQVRATTGVSIKIESQNLGVMKHKTPGVGASVPYTMKLDGVMITLTSAFATLNRSPTPSLDGMSYPMVLTVGNIAGRPAGDYKDTLTFTVSPQ